MAHVVLSAVGADRPGIVATVTRVLFERHCNIEDSAMTILGGQFAMMLVVDTPPSLEPAELEAAVSKATAGFDLAVAVGAVGAAEAPSGTAPARFTLSVHGADRPGIVHGITSALADTGVNVVDLSTRVIGETQNSVYVMVLEIEVPDEVDDGHVRQRVEEVAAELGVQASLHPSDADIL